MAEFYKMEIAAWNEGTANLTLEQEAAYLRVVNAIRLSDGPITFNKFALCGMWRCNERKAKRLLDELVAAGKLSIEGSSILNRRAVDDASTLRRLRADRASAGGRGGVESGKTRAKYLETNETREAIASTREEKRREEKNREEDPTLYPPHGEPPNDAKPRREKPRGSSLPDGWEASDRNVTDAMSRGLTRRQIDDEAGRFRDYHLAKGSVFKNWDAAWRTWVGNSIRFGSKIGNPANRPGHVNGGAFGIIPERN